MAESKRSVVIWGGTFDPVHLGHLLSAKELALTLGYESLTLMPCGDAYHKDHRITPANHRLAMLQLAVQDLNESVVQKTGNKAGQSILQVDNRETQRSGATYTVETLKELRDEMGPNAHLVWVMGTDAAQGLHKWYQWQHVFELANVIVVARNGEQFEPEVTWPATQLSSEQHQAFKQQSHGHFMTVSLTPVDISSSRLRQLLATPKQQLSEQEQASVDTHVPQVVLNYVEQHGLYQGNH